MDASLDPIPVKSIFLNALTKPLPNLDTPSVILEKTPCLFNILSRLPKLLFFSTLLISFIDLVNSFAACLLSVFSNA